MAAINLGERTALEREAFKRRLAAAPVVAAVPPGQPAQPPPKPAAASAPPAAASPAPPQAAPAAIVIESGIPLPARFIPGRPRGACPWPLAQMQPGQSLFFAEGRKAVSCKASYWGKRLGLKLSTAPATKNGVAGTRVWLVGPRKP